NRTIVAGFFVIPTNHEWTGASVNSGNWSDSDNWSAGAPLYGDYLIFPAGALNFASNTNDFPTNTAFGSMMFGGVDYILRGNPLSLNSGVVCTNAGGTNTINLNV